MAKEGAFQGYIEVNGVDLSDHCTEFHAALGHTDIPNHAMGDSDEYSQPGLKTGDVTASFIQDYAAADVHATHRPLYNNSSIFQLRWADKPIANAHTIYSGDFYVASYEPVGGAHGGVSMAAVTYRRAGNLGNPL